ncbi:MAG: hypothetical protein CMG75_04095 [Candidatus Marinimicrobia bacterium]|nr:hypothetical protein [Candidatus Neomarinimicrobiota bacterium]|tara:strand:- start:211 stop:987 length:777 start_codon:yes stop_codon:yes gene_type:complete
MQKNFLLLSLFLLVHTGFLIAQSQESYKIHDEKRPQPKVVAHSSFSRMATAPSDAIILFDGKDLSEWVSSNDGKKAPWAVHNNYFEVIKKTGGIRTVKEFGDVQLHIEWAAPKKIEGKSQGRGNSGVFFMAKPNVSYGYEVQVLDSYNNPTYPDGQASAIYGQYPPDYNATAPTGEWQTYDIIFLRPRFDKSGNLEKPAYLTVFHNGVLVHNHRKLLGPTTHKVRKEYSAHPKRLPISLQDHGNPVRFRNIWVRDLER